MRISRQAMFMEIAHVVSKRSTCFRLNVGAIIVGNNNVLSMGYNGRPAGHDHCQGSACPGRFSCKETTHAERNAINRLEATHSLRSLDLYCTDSPCQECANLIAAHGGIGRVFFARPYRITESLDWLLTQGIGSYQVMPSGSIVNWQFKEIVDEQSLIRK